LLVSDDSLNIDDTEGAPIKEPPFIKNGQKIYGKRNPNALIEARQQRLYKRQLEGLPTRHLVLEHADRESIAETTAWRDWRVVQSWNTDDWNLERESMVPRIQQMRLRIVNQAIKKGQLMTAVTALQHIGAHLGEIAPEIQALNAPVLNITVEESRKPELTSAAGESLDVAALPVCEELQQGEPGSG